MASSTKVAATDRPPASSNPADDWFEASDRWESADETVRSTAKWVITTITAFTGIVFASGGFLVQGDLGPDAFWTRAIAMATGAALAGGSLATIIGLIARSLTAEEPDLAKITDDDLLRGMAVEVQEGDETLAALFPGSVRNMEQFRAQYRLSGTLALKLRTQAGRAKAEADHLRATLKDLDDRLGAKDLDPAERSQLEARRQDLPGKLAEAQRTADKRSSEAEVMASNFAQLRATRDAIIGRVRYATSAGSFRSGGRPLVLAGVGLVLGAAIYTIAVSFVPEEPSGGFTVAKLTVHETATGDALWEALAQEGIADCAEPPGGRTMAVQKTSGTGTSSDPWAVTTIPSDRCPAASFEVIQQAGTVVVPKPTKVTIEYVREGARRTTTRTGN